MHHRSIAMGTLLLALLLPACGRATPPPAPFLRLPVSLPDGAVRTYHLDWKQESRRGPSEHGELSWTADVSLTATAAGDGGRRVVWKRLPTSPGVKESTFTFTLGADGRIDDVSDFVSPVGYQVRRGGVGTGDLVSPAAWLAARLRPLSESDIPEAAATWDVPDALDGLPMPLGLMLTLHVEAVRSEEVVLSGTGAVVIPQVEPEAQAVADWVREAKTSVKAHFVLSREDGLVTNGAVELWIESDRGWDAAGTDDRPFKTHNVLRVERR